MENTGIIALTFLFGLGAAVGAGISGIGIWSLLFIALPMAAIHLFFKTRHTDGYVRVRLQSGAAIAAFQFLLASYIGTLVPLALAYGVGWIISGFL